MRVRDCVTPSHAVTARLLYLLEAAEMTNEYAAINRCKVHSICSSYLRSNGFDLPAIISLMASCRCNILESRFALQGAFSVEIKPFRAAMKNAASECRDATQKADLAVRPLDNPARSIINTVAKSVLHANVRRRRHRRCLCRHRSHTECLFLACLRSRRQK